MLTKYLIVLQVKALTESIQETFDDAVKNRRWRTNIQNLKLYNSLMNETENNEKVLGNSGLTFNAGEIFENDRRFRRTQMY